MRSFAIVIMTTGLLAAASAAHALSDSGKHGRPEAPPVVTHDGGGGGGGGGGSGLQPNPYLHRMPTCPPGCPGKGDPFHRVR